MAEPGTDPAQIWALVAQAQAEMRAPRRDRDVTVKLQKGGSYSYSYATLAECIRSCAPLAQHGVALDWGCSHDGQDMAVTLRLVAPDGSATEPVSIPVMVREPGPQALGSGLTYARRYALTLAVGLAADDDDDGNAAEGHGADVSRRPDPRPERRPSSTPRPAARPTPRPLPYLSDVERGLLDRLDPADVDSLPSDTLVAEVRSESTPGATWLCHRFGDGSGRWHCTCPHGTHTADEEHSACHHTARAELRLASLLMGPRWETIALHSGGDWESIHKGRLDEAGDMWRAWRAAQ